MVKKISKTHLENVIKILRKEKYNREELFKKEAKKIKEKTEEINYCICFIEALFGEYEKAKTQIKLF